MKKLGFAVLALLAVACTNTRNTSSNMPAATLSLTSAQNVPGAMGTVNVTPISNGANTRLDVKVEHLAPPSKINPKANIYIVWARAANEKPQNLGALEVDKDLKGELQTLTTLRAFELFLTPEASGSESEPTTPPVLSTHVAAP